MAATTLKAAFARDTLAEAVKHMLEQPEQPDQTEEQTEEQREEQPPLKRLKQLEQELKQAMADSKKKDKVIEELTARHEDLVLTSELHLNQQADTSQRLAKELEALKGQIPGGIAVIKELVRESDDIKRALSVANDQVATLSGQLAAVRGQLAAAKALSSRLQARRASSDTSSDSDS